MPPVQARSRHAGEKINEDTKILNLFVFELTQRNVFKMFKFFKISGFMCVIIFNKFLNASERRCDQTEF